MKTIVVGAGISGLSTAWQLAKKGVEVFLLEQGPIPNPLSASGDQHRIIRRAYGGKSGYQRRMSDAFDAWDELWGDLGERHLVETGFLLLSQKAGDEADEYRQGLIDGGFALEDMSPQETADRFAFVDPSALRWGAYSPEGGVLLSLKIAAGIKAWLIAKGADVRENCRVASVDASSGSVTLESGDVLSADRVVVTAGAWVLKLFPDLSDELTTYRTAVAYLTPPPDLLGAWKNGPAILDVGGEVDGYVLPPVAGTGLKVGSGLTKYVSADPEADREPKDGEGLTIRNYFSPPFARIEEYQVERVATCAYTFTKDQHFLVRECGKTVVVSACSGHGYKFGAVVGRRIAGGILDGDLEAARIWIEARD
ncbi:MAG: FAD-dependent oxidoreductase [Rhodobacteraceae bacterium]|nr:FAD-dependent oxidoreductase [Paracoccaceae bacterium]